ncbi:hypothetical protein J437_LFUL006192 [Ladona fulva]|uniref:Intraflagellar transport protein 57 homolog n=1 Tax=Ladona fulva TaxID=123851 RepID=A0A8K0NY90_LADFU|nr:hypothetical protein J437_LFUL006192 [Ladona fulva]
MRSTFIMMRETDNRRIDDGDSGPGNAYAPFVTMEDLIDKLKLLNYHEEFVLGLKMKPLNRHYFALSTNPMEQFSSFTSLCAWLIRKSGQPFDQPQEYDDPNSTISSILDCARDKGIMITFPPSKLKQGSGENAVFILDKLADDALRTCKLNWKKPIIPPEAEITEGVSDDEAELILEKIEEELAAVYSDEDDAVMPENDIMASKGFWNDQNEQEKQSVLESTVTADEWKLEVERVLPQLKVTIKPDPRDLLYHVSDMHRYKDSMKEALLPSKINLEKLHTDITQSMEKIGMREKYLNNELEPLINEFKVLQKQLAESQDAYNAASKVASNHTQVLNQLTEELELVKQETEERGSSMTDGTPLINIKKALSQLKGEIAVQDVRIGIFEHSLLHARLRDKTKTQEDLMSMNNVQLSSLHNFTATSAPHVGGLRKF